MYHIDFVIAFGNLFLMVTGILAVGNVLLITGIIICACYYWRRMNFIKLNKDIEKSPQDTNLAPLANDKTLPDNNSQYEVCNFNSSTNNIHSVFMY